MSDEKEYLPYEESLRLENIKKVRNRAECFLVWKFGERIGQLNDAIRGDIKESWTDVVMEFFEKIEAELLHRYSFLEKQHLKYQSKRSMFLPSSQARAVSTGHTIDTISYGLSSIDWGNGESLDIDVDMLLRYKDDIVSLKQSINIKDDTITELKECIRELLKGGEHEGGCDNDLGMMNEGAACQKHCAVSKAREAAARKLLEDA